MLAAPKAVAEAVVVVTSQCRLAIFSALLLVQLPIFATVLPEDRSDVMYHRYEGGGMTIEGPSVLVRKSVADTVSISANYYVDKVSSASIDVLSTASAYSEQRDEFGVGVDYLRDRTIVTLGYANSSENDYEAETLHFNISQDFFGDLTTLSFGYSRGSDEVGRNGDDEFSDEVDRHNFRLGLTQILTPKLLVALNYELVAEEGFLNNPYRQVRYSDENSALGYSYESEIYPRTRESDAVSMRSRYYLPYRAAVGAEYRYFSDDWGISAHSAELNYTHPLGDRWMFDVRYRYYTQTAADFYSDLFPHAQAQNFLARDKELSTFKSNTFGAGISYGLDLDRMPILDRVSVSLRFDHMDFQYKDFLDVTADALPGQEPRYSFRANVLRAYVSFLY